MAFQELHDQPLETFRISLETPEAMERGLRSPALAGLVAKGWTLMTQVAVSETEGATSKQSLILVLQPPRPAAALVPGFPPAATLGAAAVAWAVVALLGAGAAIDAAAHWLAGH